MDIVSYLQDNNIIVGENNFYNKCTYSNDEANIKKQIDLFINVQKILKLQNSTVIPRIESTIGKELENFKVTLRKTEKSIHMLEGLSNMNNVEMYFYSESQRVIKRANRSLNRIINEEYINLIKRSMRNYEICIGRVDEGNIKLDLNGLINLRTVKYMSYNLIEHDIYNYIKKLKRRNYDGDIEILIHYFINNSSLDRQSIEYIKALINYPIDEMKVLSKYFLQGNLKDFNQWKEEMNVAIKNDGKEVL